MGKVENKTHKVENKSSKVENKRLKSSSKISFHTVLPATFNVVI